jgi:hypothetical protein
MINIDANIKNADWPKRTPDKFEDLVQKFDPNQPRHPKGSKEGGKFAKGGTSFAQMKAEPMPETLGAAEDRIRYEEREFAFLLKDGKPFKILGDDNRHHVFMDGATDADLKDVVLTHNHPSGYGLSNQDGVSAAKRNMLEMRAVTKDGTYSIRRTGTDWPSHFDESIADMHASLMVELGTRLHAGEITVDEANSLHHKMMYLRLQKSVGGFLYTFEPRHG